MRAEAEVKAKKSTSYYLRLVSSVSLQILTAYVDVDVDVIKFTLKGILLYIEQEEMNWLVFPFVYFT
jgi:hypothetical protein